MLQSSSEFNNLGGQGAGGWGGFGGFGGGGMGSFGLIGLIGLQDLFNKRRGDEDGGGCQKEIATLAAISNLKDINVAEARALAAEVGDVKANIKDAAYAAAIQAERNTAELNAQATAFAVNAASDRAQQTALILARINQSQIDELRDQLSMERRRVDAREVEINVTNSAHATAQQFQVQAQKQSQDNYDLHRKLDFLSVQQAKASQDIINVGGYMKDAQQTANPTNIK